jgi:hypothetical protein
VVEGEEVGALASQRRSDDTGAEPKEPRCGSCKRRMLAERAATERGGGGESDTDFRETTHGSCAGNFRVLGGSESTWGGMVFILLKLSVAVLDENRY